MSPLLMWVISLVSLVDLTAAAADFPAALDSIDADSILSPGRLSIRRSFASSEPSGFHRTIQTELEFDQLTTQPDDPTHPCRIIMHERIPKSFYYDLYQLADLWRLRSDSMSSTDDSGVLVFSSRDIELERMSEMSDEYDVFMYIPKPKWMKNNAGRYTATIRVPIHARYQAARVGGSHAKATIGPPQVYLRCQAADELDFSSGVWSRFDSDADPPVLTLEVPIGDLSHLATVRLVTSIVTITAAIILAAIAWGKSTEANRPHRAKHTD